MGLCALLVLSACGRESPPELTSAQRAEDLARAASVYEGPDYEGEGRLPGFGDTSCLVRRTRKARVDGKSYVLVAVYASERKDCDSDGQVLLTLWGQSGSDFVQLARVGGSAGRFGVRLPHRQSSQTLSAATDSFVQGLVKMDPFSAKALPAWPEDALAPALADELEFEPKTDRATYETVRAMGLMTLCWKSDDTELRCVANAPRRRPGQVELFSIHGFNDFRGTDARLAVAAVLGQARPQAKW